MDATIKGINVSLMDVETIVSRMISIPIEDGVITPLKIDISTGDVITPREIRYSFNLMLENRAIEVWGATLKRCIVGCTCCYS